MSAKFTVPRQKARYSPLLVTLHFLSQLVDEVAGTITWASQLSQQHFSKRRIPSFRPSATRLALNLCEGALPRLGFQSSQALFKNNTPVNVLKPLEVLRTLLGESGAWEETNELAEARATTRRVPPALGWVSSKQWSRRDIRNSSL